MKYIVKNHVVWFICFLIILLSFGLSIANYWSAFEQTRKQLQESSLPLSTDNIYTDIQKVIIEPSLISSMMSSDTFVLDWVVNEEQRTDKIVDYLSTIQEKYGFSHTFLVSDETKKYYTEEGVLEILSPDKEHNSWYFRFKHQEVDHEINVDSNALIDNDLLLFFNYKIYDENHKFLGVVGVVFRTSYISKMFHRFKEYFNLDVFLMNKQGGIILSEDGISENTRLFEIDKTSQLLPELLEKKSSVTAYEYDSKEYLVKSKYIKQLGLYLVVEATLSQFTGKLRQQLLINLIISLIITSVIIFIILRTISAYTSKLNYFAHYDTLTQLANRRTFNESFKKVWLQYKRDKHNKSFIFFDIDDFKPVNDTYGHPVGDKVLIRVAELLKAKIRDSDYVSRWGGEEFSILLIDSDAFNAEQIAEKLRKAIVDDSELQKIVAGGITASFGVTTFAADDSVRNIIDRADKALYLAKDAGKNCISVLTRGETAE